MSLFNAIAEFKGAFLRGLLGNNLSSYREPELSAPARPGHGHAFPHPSNPTRPGYGEHRPHRPGHGGSHPHPHPESYMASRPVYPLVHLNR
jgi:hypothetical protein